MVLFLDFPVDPRVAMPCPSSSVAKCPPAGELCLARGAHGIGRQESAEMPQGATRTTTHGSHGFYGDMGEHGQSPHVLWEKSVSLLGCHGDS